MLEILSGVAVFTLIILVLTLFVLGAKRLLVPSGVCEIRINQRSTVLANIGQRLLEVLSKSEVHLPTACGGVGTCGLCKARITHGVGEPSPQELALLPRNEIAQGVRLSCQVPVLSAMEVEVDDIYFGVNSWECTVEKVRMVATLIAEIVLKLPDDQTCSFRPGSFVQITCPPFQLDFSAMNVDQKYREVWDKSSLWSLKASSDEAVVRAYSVANKPGIDGFIYLNVRIALPPPHHSDIPAGMVSSWLFSLKTEDRVAVTGPYGLFYVEPSEKEAIFIGGGVGMAPLYAQVLDLLKTRKSQRKISYWYGARSKCELYYDDEFERLQSQYENFSWHVALSEPEAQDQWRGHTGFIHKIIFDEYLAAHPSPEDCEYYLCGPPLMVKAVLAMLDNLGVEAESIHYDDFCGG